jgi:hypothetical protein
MLVKAANKDIFLHNLQSYNFRFAKLNGANMGLAGPLGVSL